MSKIYINWQTRPRNLAHTINISYKGKGKVFGFQLLPYGGCRFSIPFDWQLSPQFEPEALCLNIPQENNNKLIPLRPCFCIQIY